MASPTERVRFHFDPGCPWCYQTSRWARRLEALGAIDLDWGLLSLEVANLPEGQDPMALESRRAAALRTAVLVRDRMGPKALGPYYLGLGTRTFETVPPAEDNAAMTRDALAEAGLDPGWCDEALADPGTWKAVVAEHQDLVERHRAFGVPTIVLDGGEGPAIFGPVISEIPDDETALELWDHVRWLMRSDNFWELKRHRARPPELPVMEWYRQQRTRG